MHRNVAAGIGSNEQGEYCRAALQRSDRKEPRYKWPTFITVWCELEQRIVDDVTDQWRRRLLACVDAEGGHFEHSL